MVRIYTKVTTLSDMVSGDGKYLLAFIEGQVNPISHYSSVNWPSQGYPPPKAWRLWKKALKKCYPHSSNRQLDQPLGAWIRKDVKWGAVWDQYGHSLYIKLDNEWHQFQKNNDLMAQTCTRFRDVGIKHPPDDFSHIAIAWIADNKICFRGIGKWQPHHQPKKTEWHQEWTEPEDLDKAQAISTAIENGTAIAMTDGSFYNRLGSAGYCIGSSFECTLRGAC